MGRIWNAAADERGFSLIEILIAGSLLAFIAVAVLPATFKISDGSRLPAYKAQCNALVRAKLQDYINGVADDATWGSQKFIPTGFEYTKRRWRMDNYGADSCSTNPTAGSPGFRESIFSNSRLAPDAEDIETYTNRKLAGDMMGFQQWVMIRHYNPRVLNAAGQPTRACASKYYQFLQLGDALEVTVTGMIRTSPAKDKGGRGNVPFAGHTMKKNPDGTFTAEGGIRDLDANTPNPDLTCSATEVIYPPQIPFRYYINGDGFLVNMQTSNLIDRSDGTNGLNAITHAQQAHFRNVWSVSTDSAAPDGATRVPISGIKSVVVSPDNKWVWVMKSNELSRYGPCSDTETGTTVVVNGVNRTFGGQVAVNIVGPGTRTFHGVPDCPPKPQSTTSGNPDGVVWQLDQQGSNISSIAVNFNDPENLNDDEIYGLPNVGSVSGGAGRVLKAVWPPTTSQIEWNVSTDFSLPVNVARVQGLFITQNYPSSQKPAMIFFNNDCMGDSSSTSNELRYCTSFYTSSDSTMLQSMKQMSVQIEGVSY